MEELATSLRIRMRAAGIVWRINQIQIGRQHCSADGADFIRQEVSTVQTEAKEFFETTVSSEAIVTDQQLRWCGKDEEHHNRNRPLAKGVIRVRVEWKEVCLRMENEMGLYENHKGPGICLSVEVGIS
jgi:hypothetical protein